MDKYRIVELFGWFDEEKRIIKENLTYNQALDFLECKYQSQPYRRLFMENMVEEN